VITDVALYGGFLIFLHLVGWWVVLVKMSFTVFWICFKTN